ARNRCSATALSAACAAKCRSATFARPISETARRSIADSRGKFSVGEQLIEQRRLDTGMRGQRSSTRQTNISWPHSENSDRDVNHQMHFVGMSRLRSEEPSRSHLEAGNKAIIFKQTVSRALRLGIFRRDVGAGHS